MTYQLLHHLAQAPLPVQVYKNDLIEKIQSYHNDRLVVVQNEWAKENQVVSIRVLRITWAGRRAVRRYLRLKIS